MAAQKRRRCVSGSLLQDHHSAPPNKRLKASQNDADDDGDDEPCVVHKHLQYMSDADCLVTTQTGWITATKDASARQRPGVDEAATKDASVGERTAVRGECETATMLLMSGSLHVLVMTNAQKTLMLITQRSSF